MVHGEGWGQGNGSQVGVQGISSVMKNKQITQIEIATETMWESN